MLRNVGVECCFELPIFGRCAFVFAYTSYHFVISKIVKYLRFLFAAFRNNK